MTDIVAVRVSGIPTDENKPVFRDGFLNLDLVRRTVLLAKGRAAATPVVDAAAGLGSGAADFAYLVLLFTVWLHVGTEYALLKGKNEEIAPAQIQLSRIPPSTGVEIYMTDIVAVRVSGIPAGENQPLSRDGSLNLDLVRSIAGILGRRQAHGSLDYRKLLKYINNDIFICWESERNGGLRENESSTECLDCVRRRRAVRVPADNKGANGAGTDPAHGKG